jgi:hypothetical protein
VCDGIGAIIRKDLVGADQDNQYKQMAVEGFVLAYVWQDLVGVLDNYCDQQTANPTKELVSIASIWQQLDLPFNEWKDVPMETFDDIRLWLGNYQQYVDALRKYVNEFPNTPLYQDIWNVINQTDSRLIATNITYPELLNDFGGIFNSFIGWYNDFFGPSGLVTVKYLGQSNDASHTVESFEVDVFSLPPNYFAVDDLEAMPIQLNILGNWLLDKFGPFLYQSSCSLCDQLKSSF